MSKTAFVLTSVVMLLMALLYGSLIAFFAINNECYSCYDLSSDSEPEEYFDVVIDSTGDTIVLGLKRGNFSEDIIYGEDNDMGLLVLRFDPRGSLAQSILLNLSESYAQMALDPWDNLIITGSIDSPSFMGENLTEYSSFVIKLSPLGEILWIRYLKSRILYIDIDRSGVIFIGGSHDLSYPLPLAKEIGDNESQTNSLITVIESDGIIRENIIVRGGSIGWDRGLVVTNTGSIYLAFVSSSSYYLGNAETTTFLLKINEDREIDWYVPMSFMTLGLVTMGEDAMILTYIDSQITGMELYYVNSTGYASMVWKVENETGILREFEDIPYLIIGQKVINVISGEELNIPGQRRMSISNGKAAVLSRTSDEILTYPTFQKQIKGTSDYYIQYIDIFTGAEIWSTYLGW